MNGDNDAGAKETEPAERRRGGGLSAEQIEAIKEAIMASIYEDIGRSIVKKILWVVGALLIALLAWATSKGYIKA